MARRLWACGLRRACRSSRMRSYDTGPRWRVFDRTVRFLNCRDVAQSGCPTRLGSSSQPCGAGHDGAVEQKFKAGDALRTTLLLYRDLHPRTTALEVAKQFYHGDAR